MKNVRFLATSAVAVAALELSGCASIVGGSSQTISVETRFNSEMVQGANCELKNPKGTFFVTTPGTVVINRAYDDLNVHCKKEGYAPGILAVPSTTKGMAFGNIIFGGFVGAAVDMGTGSAYEYPTLISVSLSGNSAEGMALKTPALPMERAARSKVQTFAIASGERRFVVENIFLKGETSETNNRHYQQWLTDWLSESSYCTMGYEILSNRVETQTDGEGKLITEARCK